MIVTIKYQYNSTKLNSMAHYRIACSIARPTNRIMVLFGSRYATREYSTHKVVNEVNLQKKFQGWV